jgi:hypothetical protein
MDFEFFLPMRIDKFEARLTELMTPAYWEETDPEIGAVEGEEQPEEFNWSSAEVFRIVYLYAMTEEEAAKVREVVTGATMRQQFDETVWIIVNEESPAFFNGARSAEETVRVMQNRVQRYLDEQG